MSGLYQLGGLAKVSVCASGVYHGVDLTLSKNRSRENSSARAYGDRQRFTCESGLIYFYRVAIEQTRIGGDDVTHGDDVEFLAEEALVVEGARAAFLAAALVGRYRGIGQQQIQHQVGLERCQIA